MTETQIIGLVARWQERLGMSGFQIAVKFEDGVYSGDNRRAIATTQRSEFYNRATIQFDQSLLSGNASPSHIDGNTIENDLVETGVISIEEYIEVTVVHELLHVSVSNLMESGDLVRHELAQGVVKMWDGAWKRAEEEFVERTALTLVRNFGECNQKKGK